MPDLEQSCVRALSNDRRAINQAMQNLLPKVMFAVLPLVALAVGYVIFYALGVSVAGMYAFLRA